MASRRTQSLLLFGGLIVTGCHAESAEPWGEAAAAILDGEITSEHLAVVGITADDQLYCSGTLVAPNVVLTAAHCLPPDAPIDATAIGVFVGQRWGEGERLTTNDVWAHPEHVPGSSARDFGLLSLDDAVGVDPLPLQGPPSTGDVLSIVGFGRVDADTASDDVKRAGTAAVLVVDEDTMVLRAEPAVTCGGDSGGPALLDGAIVGVHARGTCEFEMTEMRADRVEADVATFIESHPPPTCAADGGCGVACSPPDEDCPCALDGTCNESCSDDPDCAAAAPDGGCSVAAPRENARWLWILAACSLVRRRRSADRRACRSVR